MAVRSFQNIYQLSLAFLLSLIVLGRVHVLAKGEEKAFYAVSSLLFHIEEMNSSEKGLESEAIVFSKEDVKKLWKKATLDPSFEKIILKARKEYYAAFKNKKDKVKFFKSRNILQAVWEKLDRKLLQEEEGSGYIKKEYPHLDTFPFISKAMMKSIKPYILPKNHPLKASLDKIFMKIRAIENPNSFSKAGFITLNVPSCSLVRIARHPALRGHIVKAYLDTQPSSITGRAGWQCLVGRCIGAEKIRKLIEKNNMQYFTVPHKWVYPVKATPQSSPILRDMQQPFLLVENDMCLVTDEENELAWKQKITPRHLDELYIILSHGLGSRTLPRNIPYTKSGKFAYIDTEYPRGKMRSFKAAKKWLSPEMQTYWDELMRNGGAKVN